MTAFEHQVSENCESLDRHIAKDAARQQQRRKAAERQQDAAAMVPGPVGVAPQEPGMLIPRQTWDEADAGQQAAWGAMGLRSA